MSPTTLPPYDPAIQVPPPPPMPTMRLTPGGVLYLHHPLLTALSLKPGQAIGLLPPAYGSVFWHLDLRPTAPRRLSWTQAQRPRVEGLDLPPGLVVEPLVLHLLPGEPHYPHVHPLLPANAFAS